MSGHTMPHIGPNVTLDEPAFIHDTAQIQGKVHIGKGVSVWTYAVTRSEVHEIRIGARTNIQDFVMIHEGSGFPTIVGQDCSITHHVTLHGCEIGDRCLIGINATIMDGAKMATTPLSLDTPLCPRAASSLRTQSSVASLRSYWQQETTVKATSRTQSSINR